MTIHHRKTNGDLFDGTPDCYPGTLDTRLWGGFVGAQRRLTAWPSVLGARRVGLHEDASSSEDPTEITKTSCNTPDTSFPPRQAA